MKSTKVLLVAGGLVAGAVAGNAFTTLAQPAELDSQSTFVEMTPCRLVDTRAQSVDNTAVVQDEGAIGKETKRTYTAAGSCGIPSNATSLSVNLAAITPTSNTFMTLWDTGSDRPNSSAINPEAALSVTGNTTNVALSDSGKFDIYNNAGQVDYVIDVLGYYVDGFGTSAIPNLEDTGDGFSFVVQFPDTVPWDDDGGTQRSYYGYVVNLENEARWVDVISQYGCLGYRQDINGIETTIGSVDPGQFYQSAWVDAQSTAPVTFRSDCLLGYEDQEIIGDGTVDEVRDAEGFKTVEFTGD